jgi:predicted short-subunit dehydrogenase-like oxidoreductase (DUF2520 family)
VTASAPAVFVMGAGRAGQALAGALRACGVEIVGVHGRADGTLPARIGRAEVVLVTVGDGDLPGALTELYDAPLADGAVVLHASGARDPAEELDRLRAAGHPAGTFHPLLPLADPALAPAALARGWIGVDGDPAAITMARRLAGLLGARVVEIPAGGKTRYHAAAVMASNFPVVLAAMAVSQLAAIGVDPDDARSAVAGLLSAAAENVRSLPLDQALTGPVSRGDADTVARHLATLQDDPEALAIYVSLSWAAVALAATAGTDLDRLREILMSLRRSTSPGDRRS